MATEPNPPGARGVYAGFGFRSSEIGDVEVVHDGRHYHLFHLVLPNHDYIAHAVSRDGLSWERVENALFISHPGHWDDDMLWTMSVSHDPHRQGAWRMFYTGLSMGDRGRVQRVGMARSDDLYRWHKVVGDGFPLALDAAPYEHRLDQGRHWVSFRDPYYVRNEVGGYLLAAARVGHGPVIRRGCIALLEETEPDRFTLRAPLFYPGRYDDIEVPVPVRLDGRWYLLGSIREDVKVHYWHAGSFEGPYLNFADNVLLPQGNYAARVCRVGERWLVWNFFFIGNVGDGQHLLPPPKELRADERGELYLATFDGFDQRVTRRRTAAELLPLEPLLDRAGATSRADAGTAVFGCDSGFETFLLPDDHEDFRLEGELHMEGSGKIGLVLRQTAEGDGYYLSLDLHKGIAQLRAWGARAGGSGERAFDYVPLQANYYVAHEDPHPFVLLAYGSYLEFSLDGRVLLTLSDERYRRGRVGFYTESAWLRIHDLVIESLACPVEEAYTTHQDGPAAPGAND
jgi:beta-fructofuranosidase